MVGRPDASLAANSARFDRALQAYLRQEFSAPAAAILGYAEMLIDDARRLSLADALIDLDRIRTAGVALNSLLEATLADNRETPIDPAGLRHDLRTPINAVKGYGELLLEEADENGNGALAADLQKLIDAATAMLAGTEALIGFTGQSRTTPPRASVARIADALESIHAPVPEPANREIHGCILVVDDTEANRDLLERQLTRDGHRVLQADGGRAALDILDREPVDLVLLDLMMPDISGFDVLTRLKARPDRRDIPVIMISALDEVSSVVRCIEAGAVDYLPKPCDKTLLRARIRSSLENKSLRDREAVMLKQIQTEKERSEQLLLSILPQSIVERINAGATMISDRFPEATILFADIVNFTPLASRLAADELVAFLDAIFTQFDGLAERYGAEKIKTIGDAYMAAVGLPEPRPDHALAAADLAHAMMESVERIAAETGSSIAVRIGIHTGPVIAGIIGRKKFSYDVWGQTVNIASRMESHGEAGKINVSAAFARLVAGSFELHDRGEIAVKGSGKIQVFFLGQAIGPRPLL